MKIEQTKCSFEPTSDCGQKEVCDNQLIRKFTEIISRRNKSIPKTHPSSTSIEMPKYKCIKDVWALKIKSIITDGDGGATIIPEEPEYAPFKVSFEYISKHKPQVGGYYIVYKDGYKSFSPAKAFDEGYVLI